MTNVLTANNFGTELINSSDISDVYCIAYGMNPDNKVQIYRHISGDKEEIIEFSEKYFLKIFPGNVQNKFIPVES